jgi:hypothetical protein
MLSQVFSMARIRPPEPASYHIVSKRTQGEEERKEKERKTDENFKTPDQGLSHEDQQPSRYPHPTDAVSARDRRQWGFYHM